VSQHYAKQIVFQGFKADR